MQYQGGKSRIARSIADIISLTAGQHGVPVLMGLDELVLVRGDELRQLVQEAPPGIVCVWERPFTRTLDRNKSNQFKVTEKLFYLPPRRLEPCT